MGRRHSGRRRSHKSRINIPLITGIFGGLIAAFALVATLSAIVVGDNADICRKINLGADVAGCKSDEKYSYNRIAFVVGNTKNSPTPEISNTAKKYLTNSIVKNRDNLTVDIYSASSLHRKIRYEYSGIKKDEDTIEELIKVVDGVCGEITEHIKTDPGANGAEYIETIIRAAKSLKGKSNDGDKSLIVVYGSGLSDGGLLDFTLGDPLHSDIDKIVDVLDESKDFNNDDLKGITILWTGIGETVDPQADLTLAEKENLKEIYRAVLEGMSAKLLEFDIVDTVDESVETDYSVKTVNTEESSCIWCEAKNFSNDELGFEPNKWEISNEAIALEILNPLIAELNRNPNEIVTITGYAATDGHCGAFRGSEIPQKRADYVKNLLVRNGISSERIIALNGGHGKRANECENGYWDDSLAQQNRYIEFKASIGEKS